MQTYVQVSNQKEFDEALTLISILIKLLSLLMQQKV